MEVPEIGKPKKDDNPFVEAETAFVVFTDKEGRIVVSTDINIPLTVKRQITNPSEIWHAVAEVKRSIEVQEIAAMTAGSLQMMGQQMMAKQQNDALIQKLGPIKT